MHCVLSAFGGKTRNMKCDYIAQNGGVISTACGVSHRKTSGYIKTDNTVHMGRILCFNVKYKYLETIASGDI